MTVADRATWLQERRNGVGASDVAGILGRSPWASPWSVWVDKVGLAPLDDDEPAPHLQFGSDLEPVIVDWFERETALHVRDVRPQRVIHHRHDERWFATVDGLVHESGTDDPEMALGVFEAKYTADPPWAEVPEHYALQAQWALYCSGLDQVWLAAMHLPYGRPKFRVYEIARDELLIRDVAGEIETWWEQHVVAGRPPLADGHPATVKAMAALGAARSLWVDLSGPPFVDVADLTDVLDELAALKEAAKQVARDIARDEALIKARFIETGRTEGVVDGQVVVSWREQTRAAHEVAESTYPVLRFHTPKTRRSA